MAFLIAGANMRRLDEFAARRAAGELGSYADEAERRRRRATKVKLDTEDSAVLAGRSGEPSRAARDAERAQIAAPKTWRARLHQPGARRAPAHRAIAAFERAVGSAEVRISAHRPLVSSGAGRAVTGNFLSH
jgi:hypothetical protein